jgi:hypothetical protein
MRVRACLLFFMGKLSVAGMPQKMTDFWHAQDTFTGLP